MKRPKNLKDTINKYEEVFKVLCGKSPGRPAIKEYLTTEDSHLDLQEFCVNNSLIPWALGINVLDAVDLLVKNKE